MASIECPDCGAGWNLSHDPAACPKCDLSVEDMEAAAEFLKDRMPTPKCSECGCQVTMTERRDGERWGHCGVHGMVPVVDRYEPGVIAPCEAVRRGA